jgi:putative FmdB family regulatory protein
MPLYEYECARTGKRFEVIQKFSDAPLTRCPECDQHPDCPGEARKLLSAPAIQFKGAGWYVTDYGKGGEKPKKDTPAGDSKPAETKAESKSESKSESKPTTSSPPAKD